MQNWVSNLAAAALAIGIAGTAQATPPQVVGITETLFARTDDTLILLREMTDNHGLHSVLQTDTMVVTKSLENGSDLGFRMVARVVDMGPDAEGDRIIVRGPTDPYDPNDVFLDGARPLQEYDRTGFDPSYLNVSFDDDGGLLIERGIYEDSPRSYFLSRGNLQDQISGALAATRFFAPLERVGGGTTGPDQFNPMIFDPARDCNIIEVFYLSVDLDEPMLAQADCEDSENGMQYAKLWLVVPLIPD